MNPALYQAILRALRTLAASVIATLITLVPQVIGAISLDPALSLLIIGLLTSALNGIGKFIRGASVDVPTVSGAAAPGDKLPI